jgi:hypothetical protein
MLDEEGGCLDQEPGAGRSSLLSQDLAEGDSGAVIDGRVDIVVADASSALGGGPAVELVATPSGIRPSFLTSMWTAKALRRNSTLGLDSRVS